MPQCSPIPIGSFRSRKHSIFTEFHNTLIGEEQIGWLDVLTMR